MTPLLWVFGTTIYYYFASGRYRPPRTRAAWIHAIVGTSHQSLEDERKPDMGAIRSAVISRLPRPVAERLRAAKRAHLRDWVDESEIIASLASVSASSTSSVLVDVGARHGSVTTALFLKLGWSCVAYEPDLANRPIFEHQVGSHPRVQLSAAAASDKPAKSVSIFTLPESAGISPPSAFHDSHEPTASVDVVTLAEDFRTRQVRNLDFLKIDVEGFDYFALRGFDWNYAPRFELYGFEDHETELLGYSLNDSSSYLKDLGYHFVYSVWEPIVRHETRHRWRGLFATPPSDIADADRCLQFNSRLHRLICAAKNG